MWKKYYFRLFVWNIYVAFVGRFRLIDPPCIHDHESVGVAQTRFVTGDASMAEPGVAKGVLVRAVFITNYRPRTGFMTPQKREERGDQCAVCVSRAPLLIHHKCSFSGQLSLIFIRTTAWRGVTWVVHNACSSSKWTRQAKELICVSVCASPNPRLSSPPLVLVDFGG